MFGQVALIISIFGIAIFNAYEMNSMMIVFMVLSLCCFQFAIGTIAYMHVFQTTVDSITGFANQVLFFGVFLVSSITPTLIEHLQVSGCFAFWGGWSTIAFIYMCLCVKHTSYIKVNDDGTKEIIILTEKEKKELYWPEEYKVMDTLKMNVLDNMKTFDKE